MSATGKWSEARLGYRFDDPGLLQTALTHKSASRSNYERLEYLGDAVLELVISRALFECRPDDDEGTLSRLRAGLVKRSTLAEIATELDIGEHLQLGSGELKSGGHQRESIRADAIEAVFGAVFLDGGYDAARAVIVRLYEPRLEDLPDDEALKDPKTQLQELLQGRGHPPPEYRVEHVGGAAHDQSFRVSCRFGPDGAETSGKGKSRRAAEQVAAEHALGLLTDDTGILS